LRTEGPKLSRGAKVLEVGVIEDGLELLGVKNTVQLIVRTGVEHPKNRETWHSVRGASSSGGFAEDMID
jgi:hypothetical protein